MTDVEFPWDIKPIMRSHHEKWDGSGYPDGLAGESIPLCAQIVCIADVYDALTTSRSYMPQMTPAHAVVTMSDCRHWWCDRVFEAFLRAMP